MNATNERAAGAATPATAQENNFNVDCATRPDKVFRTLQARAALAGIGLYEIEQDRGPVYVVTRWNLSRELSSLDAAEDWLNHVTGART